MITLQSVHKIDMIHMRNKMFTFRLRRKVYCKLLHAVQGLIPAHDNSFFSAPLFCDTLFHMSAINDDYSAICAHIDMIHMQNKMFTFRLRRKVYFKLLHAAQGLIPAHDNSFFSAPLFCDTLFHMSAINDDYSAICAHIDMIHMQNKVFTFRLRRKVYCKLLHAFLRPLWP